MYKKAIMLLAVFGISSLTSCSILEDTKVGSPPAGYAVESESTMDVVTPTPTPTMIPRPIMTPAPTPTVAPEPILEWDYTLPKEVTATPSLEPTPTLTPVPINTPEPTPTLTPTPTIAIEQISYDDGIPKFSLKKDEIAFLYIPSCSIEAKIRYGSTMKAIKDNRVGEFECSQEIGVGNYCLLGHSNPKIKYVFSNLEPKAEIGDEIYVVKDGTVYVFEISETFTVNKDDVWILATSHKAKITMMCCTDNGKKRFVVVGNFVESYPYEDVEA